MAEPSLTRSAYLEASIAAAQTWLSTEYASYSGKRLPTYMARNADEFRQIGRVDIRDGQEDKALETPFAIMSIGTIGLDVEVGGLKKNRVNNGIVTGVDRDAGVSYHDSMRKAIVGLGLAFVSDGIDEVVLFAEALLMAAPVVTLSLVSDTGFVANCSLLIDPELSVPPPDSDSGGIYRFEAPLRLRTYLGYSSQMRLIKRLKVTVKDTGGETLNVGKTIYDGSPVELLSTAFTYQDLFNKDSSVYKYDHEDIHGEDT